jgi:hypothetical protein
MSREIKTGDRVRVTQGSRMPTFRAGDKGTVTSGPHVYVSGAVYYLVTMDERPRADPIIFLADEIEDAIGLRSR